MVLALAKCTLINLDFHTRTSNLISTENGINVCFRMDRKSVRNELAGPAAVLNDGVETPTQNTVHGLVVGITKPEVEEMEDFMGGLPTLLKEGTFEDGVGMTATRATTPTVVVIR